MPLSIFDDEKKFKNEGKSKVGYFKIFSRFLNDGIF